MRCPRIGWRGANRAGPPVDPGCSAAGELEARSAHGLVTKRGARTRESPHLFFSRVFYEAARDLDSQPPPRTDHVEACRPRGFLHLDYRSNVQSARDGDKSRLRTMSRLSQSMQGMEPT